MNGSFDKYIDQNFKNDSEVAAEIEQYGAYLDLATRIYELRKKAGLSQRDLAERLQTSQANIARWETPGYVNYTVKSLEKLAKFFGVILEIHLDEPKLTLVEDKNYETIFAPGYVTNDGIMVYGASTGATSFSPHSWRKSYA